MLTGQHQNLETCSVKEEKLRDLGQDDFGQAEKGLSEKGALLGRKGAN